MLPLKQCFECLNLILALAQKDHRGDDVWLKAGFAVGVVAVAVKNAVGNFARFAGNAAYVRGEAVHVERFAALGELHFFFCAFPIHKFCIVG